MGCYCNLKYCRSFCNNIWTAIEFGILQVGFNSNSSMNSLEYYCNPKYCRLGYNNIWITIEFGILQVEFNSNLRQDNNSYFQNFWKKLLLKNLGHHKWFIQLLSENGFHVLISFSFSLQKWIFTFLSWTNKNRHRGFGRSFF